MSAWGWQASGSWLEKEISTLRTKGSEKAGTDPGTAADLLKLATEPEQQSRLTRLAPANVICRRRARSPHRHVSQLYERITHRRGHQTAIGAVARHLAEATYWILTKGQPYQEPRSRPPQRTEAGVVHGGVSAPMP